jgi:hypothetical protein
MATFISSARCTSSQKDERSVKPPLPDDQSPGPVPPDTAGAFFACGGSGDATEGR